LFIKLFAQITELKKQAKLIDLLLLGKQQAVVRLLLEMFSLNLEEFFQVKNSVEVILLLKVSGLIERSLKKKPDLIEVILGKLDISN